MALAYVLIVLATIAWGASFVLIQRAIAGYSPLAFIGIRFALATVLLLPFVAGRRWPTREAWRGGAAMGLLLALAYLGQTFGLRTTSASNSGFLTGLYVVLTPLGAWLAWRRRIDRRTGASVAAATIGLALLAGASPRDARVGDLLTVGCAAAFAAHLLVGERVAPRHPVSTLNFVQFGVVALIGLAGGALAGLTAPPPGVAWAIGFTAVACTIFGFGAQTYAQARLPATTAALALSLEVPFAAIFGRLLAGDRLSAAGWVGAGLIFGAMVAVAVRPAPAVGRIDADALERVAE